MKYDFVVLRFVMIMWSVLNRIFCYQNTMTNEWNTGEAIPKKYEEIDYMKPTKTHNEPQ